MSVPGDSSADHSGEGHHDKDPRTLEIAANLADVRRRITAAASAAGRSEPTLIVVTKTWPAEDVRRLACLGVQDVGENRDQEASAKHAAVADLALTWHFIGQLQTNKAASVAGYADVVHSIDRSRLVAALGSAAVRANRVVGALVQVNLDPPPHRIERGGAAPDDARSLADLVEATEGLQLQGVMGVAPVGADPREAFDRLRLVSEQVRGDHPGAVMISAGMSDDLEQAIAAGATHVRIGSSVLGSRAVLG